MGTRMKITKGYLQQIIKEELNKLTEAKFGPTDTEGEYTGDEPLPPVPQTKVTYKQSAPVQNIVRDFIDSLRGKTNAESIAYGILKLAGKQPVLHRSLQLLSMPMYQNDPQVIDAVKKKMKIR